MYVQVNYTNYVFLNQWFVDAWLEQEGDIRNIIKYQVPWVFWLVWPSYLFWNEVLCCLTELRYLIKIALSSPSPSKQVEKIN